MFVVGFRLNSPILRDALAHTPGMRLIHEEQYEAGEGITLLFWTEGGDFEVFEEGVAVDPTVTNLQQLAETESRRLYRVTFTDAGMDAATFPAWSELDISLLGASGTHEGWTLRMRMPDRETLEQYREWCEERGLQFRLDSIHEERVVTDERPVQLTNRQRDTLLAARELGYFQIPRQSSLADVASHCSISPQAASERLRRGTATLIDALARDT